MRENRCARLSRDFNRHSPDELWYGVDNSRRKGSRHIDESVYREPRLIFYSANSQAIERA
jgi:hypothetical protein